MNSDKHNIFKKTAEKLEEQGFTVVEKDDSRPWGGFFVIDEKQAQRFADLYFQGIAIDDLKISGKLSPKILLVAPNARLSWQYHHRRAEIWQVVDGTVGIVRSENDEEGELKLYKPNDQVRLLQGERHRLIGLENWGTVAEIWLHTDPENPSDEDDIVRVQDDYSRK
ncbi:phosphoheptose isomerase [Chryseobacterium sp. Leaf180]|uniref:phosphoheptose isomerase n=1 Tax=Chryseobacterium sp. Leaf180 TaxID=1736289 RepID=UPI0006FCE92C|nr:phosphoheptose isomerase [Chryseobacterium sp. Leaf180]KQR91082.1 phosphoheptose isomerase [Chryseobacterium sp. Leaf180]